MLDKILQFIADEIKNIRYKLDAIDRKHADSGWLKAYGQFCRYRKKNGTVTVHGISAGNGWEADKAYKVLATLPVGFRPSESIYFTPNPSGGTASLVGYINPNGKINIYSSIKTTYWSYSVSFPVDD